MTFLGTGDRGGCIRLQKESSCTCSLTREEVEGLRAFGVLMAVLGPAPWVEV